MTQIIPCVVGGFLISTAFNLHNRYSKPEMESRKSFHNIFSFDASTRYIISFITGMILTTVFAAKMFGSGGSTSLAPLETSKVFFEGTGFIQSLVATFLVGLGTRLGREELTKYAFFGVPQFNPRSLMCAVVTFIFVFATATLRDNIPIFQGFNLSRKLSENLDFSISLIIPLGMLVLNIVKNYRNMNNLKEIFYAFGIGSLFASGVLISGFAKRHFVLDFLTLNKHWNPTLGFALIGILLGEFIMSRIFATSKAGSTIDNASATTQQVADPRVMSPKLFFGSALYGIGAGMYGLCLATSLMVSPLYFPYVLLFILPSILAGRFVGSMIDNFTAGRGQEVKKKSL